MIQMNNYPSFSADSATTSRWKVKWLLWAVVLVVSQVIDAYSVVQFSPVSRKRSPSLPNSRKQKAAAVKLRLR